MNGNDELTRTCRKLITRIGSTWDHHKHTGWLAILFFFLMLSASIGVCWLVGANQPHIPQLLMITARILFSSLAIACCLIFLFYTVQSTEFHYASRRAFTQLFDQVGSVSISDSQDQPKITCIKPFFGQPIIIEWLPKRLGGLFGAFEEFSQGNDHYNGRLNITRDRVLPVEEATG